MAEGGIVFRLTMPQFRQVLSVVLGPTVPDELSNKVLMVCTRPKDGVTEVALGREEAETIVAAVREAAATNPGLAGIERLLRKQLAS